MAWLTVAATLNLLFAARALGRSESLSVVEGDTVLHIVTIGVVLMLIIGMAQLLLPQFASERIGGPQSRTSPILVITGTTEPCQPLRVRAAYRLETVFGGRPRTLRLQPVLEAGAQVALGPDGPKPAQELKRAGQD